MKAGTACKMELLSHYPYMMGFIVQVWYSTDTPLSKELRVQMNSDAIFSQYFKNLNRSKIREGVDLKYIFKMLTWMSEGYLYEKQTLQQELNPHEMMDEFFRWETLLRPLIYKED